MIVSEISLWGVGIVALVVILAMIVLACVDRRMLGRMLTIFGATIAQMAIVAGVVWLVYRTNAWWAFALLYVLVLCLSICWVLYSLQPTWRPMTGPVATAMFAGSIIVAGSTLLCLPMSVFITVYSVLMACMTASMIQTMVNYRRSLNMPRKGEQTLMERILPNVRSMMQPLVMVMPVLYMGMLLGGIKPLTGLLVLLLLIASAFVANIMAGVIALVMNQKYIK